MTCLYLSAIARAEITQFSVIATDRPASVDAASDPSARPRRSPRATIAVDPNGFHDAVITDIGQPPCNAKALIEATAEAVMLRSARGGNGTLLPLLPNRGRKLMPMLFDDALEAPAQRLEANT